MKYKGKNLSTEFFENMNLQSEDFRGSNLQICSFDNSNLRNAKLSYAKVAYASFRNANLESANIVGVNFTDSALQGANFSGAITKEGVIESFIAREGDFFDWDGDYGWLAYKTKSGTYIQYALLTKKISWWINSITSKNLEESIEQCFVPSSYYKDGILLAIDKASKL